MSLTFKLNPFRTSLFCVTNICGLLVMYGLGAKVEEVRIQAASPTELIQVSELMEFYVGATGRFPAVGVPLEKALQEGEAALLLTYEHPATRTRLPIGFNNKLRGLRLSQLKEPAKTVVFYIPSFKGTSPGLTVSFADFSVSTVPYEDLGELVWDPATK